MNSTLAILLESMLYSNFGSMTSPSKMIPEVASYVPHHRTPCCRQSCCTSTCREMGSPDASETLTSSACTVNSWAER